MVDLTELATRESATVEWKENVADINDVIRTLVAFANDFLNLGGGYVVCGAKETKDINGFQAVEYIGLTSDRLRLVKEKVINECTNSNRVNPPLNPRVSEIEMPNDTSKRIIVFTIDASPNAHSFKSDRDDIARYFVRTDFSTKEATNGFVRELLRRKGQIEPWDKRLNSKASLNDIDELVLRQTLQNMRLWSSNKSIDEYLSDKEKIEEFIPPLLGRLGLDQPLHPKNFTLMVFGKSPIDFCTGAYSIFTIFEGKDRSRQHGETQWITGTIIEQANKLIEFLNIEATIAIDKSSDVANQIKYPKIALKEAVVNAIVHRDYEIDQPVRVEVYSDRIEVYSPGALPFNLDKEKFKKGNAKASWRNQSFGRIFHKLNLAQHQGSGIGRIISSMLEEGCPEPVFEVEEESVTCILPSHPRHQILKLLSEAESEIVIKDYYSAYKKLTEVLDRDVYNYRAIDLFCDVNNFLETPERVYSFFIDNKIDFNQIRPTTLIAISETLSLIQNNTEALELSKKLIDKASVNKLEERQLIKVAYTLKKLNKNKEVVEFVKDTMNRYPNLINNPYLLQQKSRALLELVKICKETINDKRQSYRIKTKAKEDFLIYKTQAEKDLSVAFQNSENPIDRDWISRDLEYLRTNPNVNLEENPERNNASLRISNIPLVSEESTIRRAFSKYGNVLKVNLHTNEEGTFNGIAKVQFETSFDAIKAFEDSSNISINDKRVIVKWYLKKN